MFCPQVTCLSSGSSPYVAAAVATSTVADVAGTLQVLVCKDVCWMLVLLFMLPAQ
jgi:hypothetical protein